MKVDLISFTPEALELLIYTKNTRLKHERTLRDVFAMSDEEKQKELDYMRGTIQSSWEFVDYIFEISGVSRAFTHQLVRTRQGSYAQESQRTVNVSEANVVNTCSPKFTPYYESAVQTIMQDYANLLEVDCPIEDARGLLPTNIETSIIAKFDLRTIHNMGLLRLCYRTQGEYQKVFQMMVEEIVNVHPWAKDFIKVHCAWYGTCAFPNHEGCPIKQHTADLRQDKFIIQRAYDELIK